MNRFLTFALLGSMALSACASSPDKMSAMSVSTLAYESYDCDQIAAESQRVERRVAELYGQLKKTADNDSAQMAVGLVLFWPALFFLEGGDGPEAAEYRRLKGEYEALQKVSVQKKCGLEFQSMTAPAETQASEPKRSQFN